MRVCRQSRVRRRDHRWPAGRVPGGTKLRLGTLPSKRKHGTSDRRPPEKTEANIQAQDILSNGRARPPLNGCQVSRPVLAEEGAKRDQTTNSPRPGPTTTRHTGHVATRPLDNFYRLPAHLLGHATVLAEAGPPLRWPLSIRVDAGRGAVRFRPGPQIISDSVTSGR
jgi:hypothetical protein